MSDSESQASETEFQTSVFENAFQKAWDGLIGDRTRVADLQDALGQLPEDKEWMDDLMMNEHKEKLFQIILDNRLCKFFSQAPCCDMSIYQYPSI